MAYAELARELRRRDGHVTALEGSVATPMTAPTTMRASNEPTLVAGGMR
jgi:hypothetical protein